MPANDLSSIRSGGARLVLGDRAAYRKLARAFDADGDDLAASMQKTRFETFIANLRQADTPRTAAEMYPEATAVFGNDSLAALHAAVRAGNVTYSAGDRREVLIA